MERNLDWIHLPENVKPTSLWSCLHDGELVSCVSNKLDRSATLKFKVAHLTEDNEENLNFIIKLNEVTSLRANLWFLPLEKFTAPEGISRDEYCALVREYQEKFREESVSWSDFESFFQTDPLLITDADYVSDNKESTVKLGGHFIGEKQYDSYCSVFLRGKQLSAFRSDNREFSLETFIAVGERYWQSLRNKN